MNIPPIKGIVCPMVTPFDELGSIDEGATRSVIDFLLGHGVDVLFPGGTNGEGMLLDVDERKKLAEIVVQHAAGRAPVIIHTGCIATRETVTLTRHARDIGATAAAVIVPYYFSFDDSSLLMHYLTVARAVPDFPIFLYSNPGTTKSDISPALMSRICAEAPNIVGAKISNPDLLRFQEYVACSRDGFMILNGVDGLMLPALSVGSQGQVTGNANVFPEVFCDLYRAFVAGDLETARAKQQLINRIRDLLSDGRHPAYFKAGLALRGVAAGRVRPPMRELTAEEWQTLEAGARDVGVRGCLDLAR